MTGGIFNEQNLYADRFLFHNRLQLQSKTSHVPLKTTHHTGIVPKACACDPNKCTRQKMINLFRDENAIE